MLHPVVKLLQKNPKRVLGLMSGTSADGLDCALCTIAGSGAQTQVLDVQARTYPYSKEERSRILAMFEPGGDVSSVCQDSFWLAERFADLALQFLTELGISPRDVDLVGSHGQTVWHQPPSACKPGQTPSTLQLGEPAVIAARTGIVTVGDFRVADVALGGEGAPLVPYCDYLLFRKPGLRRALQNIGGIANVTVLADRAEEVLAFDNGPGNMLIDALAPLASCGTATFDQDGELSARGRVLPEVLADLLDDDYLRRAPPKSTGRERYGHEFATALLHRYPSAEAIDLLATAVAFTAHAIADSLRPLQISELLVSGGGGHNRTLMATLERLLHPTPVRKLAELGIDIDNKEAVAFAVLAVQTVHNEPSNLPQVTGARRGAVLGKLCFPPL